MPARAGHDYDVLVVGYVSRFTRNLLAAVNAREDLHAAGAAIFFADEGLLSSDEAGWENWARETVKAEAYSRRLVALSALATRRRSSTTSTWAGAS